MKILGQDIEVFKDSLGWTATWVYEVGIVEIGFFESPAEALDAITNFIQHDLVLRSLLPILDEWKKCLLIDDEEYSLLADSLVEFTLSIDI